MDVLKGITDDTLLVFIGYSDDARDEIEAVLDLEERFQAELDVRREVMGDQCPFSRVRVWEWKRDAASFPSGQSGLIDPIIERADIAVFVFKERIGKVTWEELDRFRTKHEIAPTLTLFPDQPPLEGMKDPTIVQAWQELILKRHELSEGWQDATNRPVRQVDDYRDIDHLCEIALAQFQRNLPFVLTRSGKSTPDSSHAPGLLGPPEFPRCIRREEAITKLDRAVKMSSIVVVEGISGSGKSSMVAHYLLNDAGKGIYRRVFWFDPEPGACLEDLLTTLAAEMPLTAKTTHAKCKQLREFLRQDRAVLVIDDFHVFSDLGAEDQLPLRTLFKFLATAGAPTRLILLSQLKIPIDTAPVTIEPIELDGFKVDEAADFLAEFNFDEQRPDLLHELVRKTDGLPLALEMFAMLLRSGKYSAGNLLGGDTGRRSRLHSWFKRVASMVEPQDRRLLSYLALYGAPFPEPVVSAVAAGFGITASIDSLERSLLVQRYAEGKWKIHHLISEFLRDDLSRHDAVRVHRLFANFHKQGWSGRRKRLLTDETFLSLEQACKHEQLAGRKKQAEQIFKVISPTAKGRGYYEKLKRLARTHAELFKTRDPWIDYDYAHCCFITGDLNSTLKTLDSLFSSLSIFEPNLRVQAARLHAESNAALGRPAEALSTLRDIRDSLTLKETSAVNAAVHSQATSCEIELLTILEQYDEAESLCRELMETAHCQNDKRAGAVVMTRWGIIELRRGNPEAAIGQLSRSVDLFKGVRDAAGKTFDRRGLAWSLSYLSASQVALGDNDEAVRNLKTAMKIKSEIEDVSVSYQNSLSDLLSYPYSPEIKASLHEELVRVENQCQL